MNSKSKLQELCQKKSWGFPEYKTEKLGLNHNPSFKSTVTVNGISFESPHPGKNLKNSQADAADLALQYLLSTTTTTSSASLSSALVSAAVDSAPAASDSGSAPAAPIPHLQPTNTILIAQPNPTNTTTQPHLYKSQLQSYAQKNGFPLPEYACTPDGPPHACRFTCTVTVAQLTYHSPLVFNTVKESENAAAKLALLSLLPGTGTPQDDLPVYKNLLQELAQKQGFSLPTYTTHTNGLSHIPTFVASVTVKGEIFQGEIAKTKKQAEMNAAKVAYTIIKELFIAAGGVEGPKTITPITVPATDMLKMEQPSINNNHSSESKRKRGPSEIPADVVKEEQSSGSGNDGRCKKVCIFPRNLNMELPPGKTVFSDDRWIAIETCQAEAT